MNKQLSLNLTLESESNNLSPKNFSGSTLYDRVISFENLLKAYGKARLGRRNKKYVLDWEFNLEKYLISLEKELQEERYVPGAYHYFWVCDPKKRLVATAPFKDRIVHHAVYNVIEPIFDKSFIYDTYACRKGKGLHTAVERLQQFLRKKDAKYALNGDVEKYFDSINHRILEKLLREKIKDEKLMRLLVKIIRSEKLVKGIPIGNLTSQLFAGIYLSKLDHFIKRGLQAKYYLRYMDDFLILAPEKPILHQWREEIRRFLKDRLDLNLKKSTGQVFPTHLGVDFVGFVTFSTHRLVRKVSLRRFWAKAKKGNLSPESINSYGAHFDWADSFRLKEQLAKLYNIDWERKIQNV